MRGGVERRLAVLVTLVLLGCPKPFPDVPVTIRLVDVQVIDAVPAAQGPNGQAVRACTAGQAASGVIFDVALVGTKMFALLGEEADKDLSLRPGFMMRLGGGDTEFQLKEGETIRASQFQASLDCLEPYLDKKVAARACDSQLGVATPGAVQNVAPQSLSYRGFFTPDADGSYPRTFLDGDALGVAILVDQSGSMKGFVEKKTRLEVNPWITPTPWDGLKFGAMASDKFNGRLAAVESLLSSLNSREKAIVFQFGEKTGPTPTVVCYNPDGRDEESLRNDCFGTNRGLVLGQPANVATGAPEMPSELAKLQSEARGRTPLWSAVSDAYDFMKNAPSLKVRHVVVIGDGPDTCALDSPAYLPRIQYQDKDGKDVIADVGLCAGFGYAAFRSRVLADLADATAPRVQVSFIQFQAPGYLERDPSQQEMACLTGGYYVFLNSEDATTDDGQFLESGLHDAVVKIRYGFAGAWALRLDVPDLAGSKLPAGAQIALQGSLSVIGGPDSLVLSTITAPLAVGKTDDSIPGGLPTFDRRVAIRKPCNASSSCTWYPSSSDGCWDSACVADLAVCAPVERDQNRGCPGGICCGAGCWQTAETECKVP